MSENLTIDEILRQAEEIRKKTARKAEAAIDKIHATQTPLEPQPKEPTVTAAPGVDDKTPGSSDSKGETRNLAPNR